MQERTKISWLKSRFRASVYHNLFRNRSFMLLWSGQTVSIFGDAFFNIAVTWMVYIQSDSILQTAIVQVVWHLSDILFGPLAGSLADRIDRKRIIVITNLLAAVVMGMTVTVIIIQGQISSLVAYVAVFLLNGLTTFLYPARFAIMPAIVNRDHLATASGLFSTAGQVATLVGSALAGVVISVIGAVWAVVIDACSFLFAALFVLISPIPTRNAPSPFSEKRQSLLRETIDGWGIIADRPVIKGLVWLTILINVASFMGPLYPALVKVRLHGDAAAYGVLQAIGVIGGMVGGVLAGTLERRVGAGRLLVTGWILVGIFTLGIAASPWLLLTVVLGAAQIFCLTASAVSLNALTQALVPEDYLGRVAGTMAALSVVAIPISTLIGGWLADILGPAPLFATGGVWILGVAGLAWSTPQIRLARI